MYNLDELMQYFGFQICAYGIIPLILARDIFKIFCKNHTKRIYADCVTISLLGISLWLGFIFQRALIDITNGAYIEWFHLLLSVFIVYVVLSALYIILLFRSKHK
jgi:hypothetical protein